jgi:hypothetical protein
MYILYTYNLGIRVENADLSSHARAEKVRIRDRRSTIRVSYNVTQHYIHTTHVKLRKNRL